MSTISADVTPQMVSWLDSKIKKGLYKSRSEFVRELFRKNMLKEKYPNAMASQKVLEKIWDNEEDEIWESYV
jgi:Arc/MetJ-type ribon-helix-helix transcriptional regulator